MHVKWDARVSEPVAVIPCGLIYSIGINPIIRGALSPKHMTLRLKGDSELSKPTLSIVDRGVIFQLKFHDTIMHKWVTQITIIAAIL